MYCGGKSTNFCTVRDGCDTADRVARRWAHPPLAALAAHYCKLRGVPRGAGHIVANRPKEGAGRGAATAAAAAAKEAAHAEAQPPGARTITAFFKPQQQLPVSGGEQAAAGDGPNELEDY